ncbi:MAG: hypothetical protein R3Y07_06545 [Eubacteriales bacterium]
MVDTTKQQYFLGANSPDGFHSLYQQMVPPKDATAIYILKGGAGCGKSTLMRQLSAEAMARGIPVDEILCSGDPDSLDGVIFPTLKIAVADGTAPHVIEPQFAGVVERYVNLGECYDSQKLQEVRGELVDCMTHYSECCALTIPCLAAAGELGSTISSVLVTPKLEERLAKRASGILSREVKAKGGQSVGSVTQRFLSGNTCKGRLSLLHTATNQCEKVYVLWDSYGIASHLLLPLLTGAVNRGYHVIACLNPMFPKQLEHLIIPELGLCFLSSTPSLPVEGEHFRKIRMETLLDSGLLHQNRSRLRIYRKMYHSLLEEVVATLAENKLIHDRMEEIYHPYVNFDLLSEFAKKLGEEIFP